MSTVAANDATTAPPADGMSVRAVTARILCAAIAMVAVSLVAGCGSSGASSTGKSTATAPARTVDTMQVESQIKIQLSTSAVTVTNVKCPSDVPVKQGDTFTCTVYFSNSGGGKVKVTQQGANHYTYTIVPSSVTVPGSWADQQLEAALAKQGAPNATVNCPSTIVVKVGTTVTCDVAGAKGGTGQVTFTFSSANGTVDTSSVQES